MKNSKVITSEQNMLGCKQFFFKLFNLSGESGVN